MMTLYRERLNFEKQLLAELSPRLKKTKWKKSKCVLFTQYDAFYQDLFISVHRNSVVTKAELRVKPLALDTILWDVLNIPENGDEPLSFRTWGAFTCSGLPICETEVEESGDTPGIVADKLVSICAEKATLFTEVLSGASFSELIAAHPNQVERGAYAVTLVTSLINDGKLELARQTAYDYASGALISCAGFESGGKTFHQLALEWLDAGRSASSVIGTALRV